MSHGNPTKEQYDSLHKILTRLSWIFLGPAIIVFLLVGNIQGRPGWFTSIDVAFLIVLFALPVLRWLDFHTGTALTSDGKPATSDDVRRYAILIIIVGLLAWVAANVIGNYLLAR